ATRNAYAAILLALQQRCISLDDEVAMFGDVRPPDRADLLHESALLLRQSRHGYALCRDFVVHVSFELRKWPVLRKLRRKRRRIRPDDTAIPHTIRRLLN